MPRYLRLARQRDKKHGPGRVEPPVHADTADVTQAAEGSVADQETPAQEATDDGVPPPDKA